MTTNRVVIFHDEADHDIAMGLSYLWEILMHLGSTSWISGKDMMAIGFAGVEPCDVYLINTTLPVDTLTILKHFGFRLIFIGNKFSPPVTYATSLHYDVVIIVGDSPISAILFGYYVYLNHAALGNRLDFLPTKLVSDNLNFIYNNNLSELTVNNLVSGVYIMGVQGPILKQNIGSVVTDTINTERRLKILIKSKGTIYV